MNPASVYVGLRVYAARHSRDMMQVHLALCADVWFLRVQINMLEFPVGGFLWLSLAVSSFCGGRTDCRSPFTLLQGVTR